MRMVAALIFAAAAFHPAAAQLKVGGGIEFDKDVHDFGDIQLGSGPVSCTFTVKNTGNAPIAVYSVVSSCGCTDAEWTKSPIPPGGTGTISATYSNNEGAMPFDKNLTVYLSGVKKPVILKLRGVCHEKKPTLGEIYPLRFGALGFRTLDVKCGNILQGECRSGEFKVANLGDRPVKVRFKDLSEGLSIEDIPGTIPAGGEAEVRYTVQSSPEKWGKNSYCATPVVNGTSSYALAGLPEGVKAGKVRIYAYTSDNFSSLSEAEKSNGPIPRFKTSSFTFGKIRAGKVIEAEFEFKNEGKRTLVVHKCDVDAQKSSHDAIPPAAPGESGKVRVRIDSSLLPKGETLVIVTLTTNSPLRPMVNLFISGAVE